MSDLSPIPALPPAPAEPARPPGWWSRLVHRRAARDARLLAAHHADTTERARHAQIALVRDGYHLGPIPYGYLPLRVGPRRGGERRRIRLLLDPGPASVVVAIYRWRIEDRLTPHAIATRLRSVETPAVLRIDPATGFPRPWTSNAVTRVLANPTYTGATVWGRTHAGRPVPPDAWVIRLGAHQPIIDGATFYHAQLLAPPGAGVFSVQLPPWAFTESPPTDQGNTDSSREPSA
ncbi:recombinase family protein [Frankia sp. R82]|uniref:recombinase family protein n=1 Tax=Frankia sp. R82 TaxID=2950553 RepID=UPI002044AF77|nr:recombinase family protein [Frankia sp. R82]MCM3885172.1 recombinase family protein [Frankia sp. R82]